MKKSENSYNRIENKVSKYLLTTFIVAASCVLGGCSIDQVSDKADKVIEKVNDITDVSSLPPVIEITETDSVVEPVDAAFIDLTSWEMDTLEINHPGFYVLSGDYKGQVYIDVDDELVHLFLNNVNIHSKAGSAIYVKSASKVVLTSVEGTKNSLTDGMNHKAYEEENACIYADCDLTINGPGQLFVYGYYKDGVKSKDILKVIGTNLSVLAKRDGLKGNDGVLVSTNSLIVQCEETGIKTKNEDGNVEINGGACTIVAGEYGIDSEADLYAHGCVLDIKAVIDAVHAKGDIYAE